MGNFFTDLQNGLGFVSRTVALSPKQGNDANAQSGFASSMPIAGMIGAAVMDTLSHKTSDDLKKGYGSNPYVFACANWKAMRIAQALPIVYAIKDEKAYQSFRRFKAQYQPENIDLQVKSRLMQAKALEEVSPTGNLEKILSRPNDIQTWTELMFAMSVYYDFGNALVRGITLQEGLNKGQMRELWMLPTARWSGVTAGIEGYKSYTDNAGQSLDAKEVLHLRRFAPDYESTSSALWGKSLLHAAPMLLARSNESMKAEAALMSNQGPKTILFPKGASITDAEESGFRDATKVVQRKLQSTTAGGVTSFNIELGKLDIGLSPVDLNILQSNQLSREDFCALWKLNVLSVFSTMQGATYANLEQANIASVRAGVLPDLMLIYEKLSAFLFPGDLRKKFVLMPNTDVYPELQPDWKAIKEKADAALLTGDERRVLNGWSAMGTPEMQVPLIPSGYAPMSDFAPGAGGSGDVTDEEKMY